MERLGYQCQDIQEAIEGRRYNEVMGTYLILRCRKQEGEEDQEEEERPRRVTFREPFPHGDPDSEDGPPRPEVAGNTRRPSILRQRGVQQREKAATPGNRVPGLEDAQAHTTTSGPGPLQEDAPEKTRPSELGPVQEDAWEERSTSVAGPQLEGAGEHNTQVQLPGPPAPPCNLPQDVAGAGPVQWPLQTRSARFKIAAVQAQVFPDKGEGQS
ncbi:serine/threonine-protein kinase MARK2-like [Talpa occidentalis]|uniref:serine/threonine-protein kinase MARK2-like n=1 Tax=Talpa occidentalis TaxID=50954 RepID=UPI0023F6B65B|nr:serine/threonine-protein kinase MARK2-like [Talpa occidentalis]XP_054546314.1 serine/threonine-protein kinase MARK2-like [Talpa occidentalis]XP_054546315.1 serine/threonine-protein kinase MARK2-like [Talpa occidentalis]XP_054546316.1 serine/threonine-protein kinase MARK2-like [Talpa occidentalis]